MVQVHQLAIENPILKIIPFYLIDIENKLEECLGDNIMLSQETLDSWKVLAKLPNKMFHPEVVLALLAHIEQQDKNILTLQRELDHNDYMDQQQQYRDLKNGLG